jgi:hypothetical protein
MAKYTPRTIANLDNPPTVVSQINYNFETLSLLIDTLLSRDGAVPNAMQSSLDMNGNRILNLPVPVSYHEAARHGDLQQYVDRADTAAELAEGYAEDAKNSEFEVQADKEEFQAAYVGAYDEPPTVDKNGHPIQDGALYYNTPDGTLYAYSVYNVLVGTDRVVAGSSPVLRDTWFPLPVPTFFQLADVDVSEAVVDHYLYASGGMVYSRALEADYVLQNNGFYTGQTVQDALDDVLERTSLGIYDIGFWCEGLMENNEQLFRMVVSRPFQLVAGAPGSRANAAEEANSTTVIRIFHNATQVGTITFAAGSVNGVFALSGTINYEPGDILRLVAPASADTALRHTSITLACRR